MLIAIKTQALNPNNTQNVPSYWPWKRVEIHDNDRATYEADGWTVYTQSELDAYLEENKPKLESHYLSQLVGTVKYLDITVKKRKEYADELIEKLKKKNIAEGINLLQAFHVQQKIRAMVVNFPPQLGGLTFTIDLMNLVVSGDLEVACIALQYTAPDPMTAPYHWMNQDRINWIVAELKKFLGWP
jgi:hypothetical protein